MTRLPDKYYVIVTANPDEEIPFAPMTLKEQVGSCLLVFFEEEGAERFLASPHMEVPGIVKGASIEALPTLLEYHAKFHEDAMAWLDPAPPHERDNEAWFIVPAEVLAQALREELGVA